MMKAKAVFEIGEHETLKQLAAFMVDEMEQRGLVLKSRAEDALIEVADIRAKLGRRPGQLMAPKTFEKLFLETGLLTIVDPAKTPNRAKRYCLRSEVDRVLKQHERGGLPVVAYE
jgi:hypothetical protein